MSPAVKVTVTEHGGRSHASTGSDWETKIGYSRAIRVENTIYVTGTVGVEADGSYAPTASAQARRALAIILAAVEALGGTASGVVRTRIYLTRIADWKEVGAVHGEIFGNVRPATTLVEVARLIDDAARVEIEADVVLRSEVTNPL